MTLFVRLVFKQGDLAAVWPSPVADHAGLRTLGLNDCDEVEILSTVTCPEVELILAYTGRLLSPVP